MGEMEKQGMTLSDITTNGKVIFDNKRKKFIIEFDFPPTEAEAIDIHVASSISDNNTLQVIGKRIYEAFELIGKKFYTKGGEDIALRKNEAALMTVKIIL